MNYQRDLSDVFLKNNKKNESVVVTQKIGLRKNSYIQIEVLKIYIYKDLYQ